MSKTIAIPGFIHAKPASEWDSNNVAIHNGFILSFWPFDDMREQGYSPVCPAQVSFELPAGWDPRQGQIDILKSEEQALRAQFHVRVTEIQAQINKLQALEMA